MINKIKKLRELTGAGIMDVKKALQEADGNEEKAREILRKKGQEKAAKKSDRAAGEGMIASYVHSNRRVGAMVKLLCETDFVARNEEFKALAYDIAMHVAAMDPQYIRPEDVPEKVIEKEREIWTAQMESQKKPKEIMEKILEGKEKKFREEISLLTQSYVKDPETTVGELITEAINKIGENIRVGEISRLNL